MSAPGAPPAADRGTLTIHPSVLRKIIEQVADQVPGTLRHDRKVAGIDVGEAGSSAKVTVGSGDRVAAPPVDVALELTLQYPGSVRDVVAEVRRRVTAELDRQTGHRMRALRVTVGGLRDAPTVAAPRLH